MTTSKRSKRTRRTGRKRVVAAGDSHCGHIVGLTPPSWQIGRYADGRIPRVRKWRAIQKECWKFFKKQIDALKPIDVLLWMGDSLDGRGERSGSTELMVVDRHLQVVMASDVIDEFEAETIVMAYGTGYHTGNYEDWEDLVAEAVEARKIGSHEWVDVNGYVFDIKHHIGRSVVPYGRKTAPSRAEIWNTLWADANLQPRADAVIRGHVHYCEGGYRYAGTKQKWAITTPALQAMGTKYGSRRCEGLVHFGLTEFIVEEDGSVLCPINHVAEIKSQRARVLKV